MKFSSNKMSTGTHALTSLILEHTKQEVQGEATTPEDSGAAGKTRENSGGRENDHWGKESPS